MSEKEKDAIRLWLDDFNAPILEIGVESFYVNGEEIPIDDVDEHDRLVYEGLQQFTRGVETITSISLADRNGDVKIKITPSECLIQGRKVAVSPDHTGEVFEKMKDALGRMCDSSGKKCTCGSWSLKMVADKKLEA